MVNLQTSIRHKITLGYYLAVAMIVGLSFFAFIELGFIEKKIIFGDVITEFFDTTLEIRRFEKNYFLYGKENDYRENIKYVKRAMELIDGNMTAFRVIADESQIIRIRADLELYLGLIGQYGPESEGRERLGGVQVASLERRIRETGKDIITIAEDISKTERRYIQKFLSTSRTLLIFSILVLSVMVIFFGQVLSRMIVRPLKLLEKSMQTIAEGRFETIRIDSKDREIVSLTNAFSKMLKELELRQRHLVQSEKLASLGTLLSGVAHELNNPLSNISSSCQILMEEINEADPEFRNELLMQIDEQTDRARNIVRSLLEFSRDREFKKEMLSLSTLFEETIRFLKGQVPSKVEVIVDVPADITIYADKQRIQQAFLNLIKNAVESVSEEGVVSIQARTHSAAEKIEQDEPAIYNYLKYSGKCTMEDDTVDITIHDTGSGIEESVLPKVFDPFFTTKDVGKGSGLGLFIVHEIVEEHDGCIAVDSEVGKGTTFLIRLKTGK